MLNEGDLVRIPADTCIIQDRNDVSLIERYRYTMKPEVGIFIRYDKGMDALVFLRNEYCLINSKDINLLRKKVC